MKEMRRRARRAGIHKCRERGARKERKKGSNEWKVISGECSARNCVLASSCALFVCGVSVDIFQPFGCTYIGRLDAAVGRERLEQCSRGIQYAELDGVIGW